jgi:hypothetical protein
MKYVRFTIAIFFVVFAFADIALAGSCCEESFDDKENESACFCCCTHLIIEHTPKLTSGPFDMQLFQNIASFSNFVFSSQIYHPPRLS